jgi:hypothetical protein
MHFGAVFETAEVARDQGSIWSNDRFEYLHLREIKQSFPNSMDIMHL